MSRKDLKDRLTALEQKNAKAKAKAAEKPKNPPHRPPHKPTPESRAAVQAMTALGITQEQICEYLSKFMKLPLASKHSLLKHYSTEIGLAKTHQVLMVSQGLYRKAVGAPASFDERGNKTRDEIKPEVTAQIFWLKCKAGWQEPPRFATGDDDGLSLVDLINASYQAGKKTTPPTEGGPAA